MGIRTKPNVLPITTTIAPTAPTNSTAPENSTAPKNSTTLSKTPYDNIEISVAVQLPGGTNCPDCSLQMTSGNNKYEAKSGEKLKVKLGSYKVKLLKTGKLPLNEHTLEHDIKVTRPCRFTIVLNKKGQEDKLIDLCKR